MITAEPRLAHAREELGMAEADEVAAMHLVEERRAAYAAGEIQRSPLQRAQNDLASKQERTESLKALIRRLEREGVAQRETQGIKEQKERAKRVAAARAAMGELEREFGHWLREVDDELGQFDQRAKELYLSTGGLAPQRSFTDSRPGGHLASGIASARRIWAAPPEREGDSR